MRQVKTLSDLQARDTLPEDLGKEKLDLMMEARVEFVRMFLEDMEKNPNLAKNRDKVLKQRRFLYAKELASAKRMHAKDACVAMGISMASFYRPFKLTPKQESDRLLAALIARIQDSLEVGQPLYVGQ